MTPVLRQQRFGKDCQIRADVEPNAPNINTKRRALLQSSMGRAGPSTDAAYLSQHSCRVIQQLRDACLLGSATKLVLSVYRNGQLVSSRQLRSLCHASSASQPAAGNLEEGREQRHSASLVILGSSNQKLRQ